MLFLSANKFSSKRASSNVWWLMMGGKADAAS